MAGAKALILALRGNTLEIVSYETISQAAWQRQRSRQNPPCIPNTVDISGDFPRRPPPPVSLCYPRYLQTMSWKTIMA